MYLLLTLSYLNCWSCFFSTIAKLLLLRLLKVQKNDPKLIELHFFFADVISVHLSSLLISFNWYHFSKVIDDSTTGSWNYLLLRDYPYITSANFRTFWDPTNTLLNVRKTVIYWTHPVHMLTWYMDGPLSLISLGTEAEKNCWYKKKLKVATSNMKLKSLIASNIRANQRANY